MAKMDQYLDVLKEVLKLRLPLDVATRLHILLSTLVNQVIEQRQVIDGKIDVCMKCKFVACSVKLRVTSFKTDEKARIRNQYN